MRSTTFTRGARRLLVTAGVMTLGLATVVPTTAGAHHDDDHAQGGDDVVAIVGNDGNRQSDEDRRGDEVAAESRMIWVCHVTSGVGNPYELIHISERAYEARRHEDDRVLTDEEVLRAADAAEVDLTRSDLNRDQDEGIATLIDALCGTSTPEEEELEEEELEEEEEEELEVIEDEVVLDPVVTEPTPAAPVTPATPAAPATPATPETPAVPATPAAPPVLVDSAPKPVTISTDTVTKPVTPATPTNDEAEVLGSVTTRTPGGAVIATELPRTGADSTTILAVAGIALLLAGLGLEAASRRTARVAV